jgi:hypothetical protein
MAGTWSKADDEFTGIEVATVYKGPDLLVECDNALLIFF